MFAKYEVPRLPTYHALYIPPLEIQLYLYVTWGIQTVPLRHAQLFTEPATRRSGIICQQDLQPEACT